VNRGGSWNNDAENATASNRNNWTPDNRNDNLGFRLASSGGSGGVYRAGTERADQGRRDSAKPLTTVSEPVPKRKCGPKTTSAPRQCGRQPRPGERTTPTVGISSPRFGVRLRVGS